MADPQELPPPPRAAQMHERDERLLANIGIPAAIFIAVGAAGLGGIFTGWPHVGGAFALFGFGGALIMRLHLVKTAPAPAPKSITPFWRWYLTAIALLTWAFVGWQSWMWFHPPAQSVQGYTQAQQDDAIAKAKEATAKPLQDKLDQAGKDYQTLQQSIPKQIADAIAKATAQPQTKSDTPVSVDKLPTSLRVLFNSDGTYGQLEQKNIAAWQPINLLDPGGLLVRPPPVFAFIIVFKKPIAFDDVQVDGHNTGMIGNATTKDPAFVIVSFNYSLVGLVDIVVQNKHK